MKKFITGIISAAIIFSNAPNVLAINNEIYSSDKEALSAALEQTSDNDIEDFINENLDVKLQDMSILVTLTANQNYEQIEEAVSKAVDDGLTAIEIKEAIYQSAPYCGYTRAIKAMDEADKALISLEIELSSKSRITSTNETRYNDGLKTQRKLFGSQIGTITDDMSESQKLQTIYLSGICFRDFYNRTGLDLNTREFLTFCTIAANGNCLGQLNGHTNGNIGIGHSTDMLRAAVLLNEEYNGKNKTLDAMAVINTVSNS